MTCLCFFCFIELELELIQSHRTGANTIPDDTHTRPCCGVKWARVRSRNQAGCSRLIWGCTSPGACACCASGLLIQAAQEKSQECVAPGLAGVVVSEALEGVLTNGIQVCLQAPRVSAANDACVPLPALVHAKNGQVVKCGASDDGVLPVGRSVSTKADRQAPPLALELPERCLDDDASFAAVVVERPCGRGWGSSGNQS